MMDPGKQGLEDELPLKLDSCQSWWACEGTSPNPTALEMRILIHINDLAYDHLPWFKRGREIQSFHLFFFTCFSH